MNDDRRPPMFVHSALDDSDLSAAAFRVLGHICRCAGNNQPAWPGTREIARACRLNKDTSGRAIRELAEAGWIERRRRPGKTNYYFPKWPDGLSENRGCPKIGVNPSIGTGLSENRGQGLSENRGHDSNPRRKSKKEIHGTGDRFAITSNVPGSPGPEEGSLSLPASPVGEPVALGGDSPSAVSFSAVSFSADEGPDLDLVRIIFNTYANGHFSKCDKLDQRRTQAAGKFWDRCREAGGDVAIETKIREYISRATKNPLHRRLSKKWRRHAFRHIIQAATAEATREGVYG